MNTAVFVRVYLDYVKGSMEWKYSFSKILAFSQNYSHTTLIMCPVFVFFLRPTVICFHAKQNVWEERK